MSRGRSDSLAVAVFAPIGRDALLASELLARDSVEAIPCRDFDLLVREIRDGIGAVLITEEELTSGRLEALTELLRAQAPWSDLPIVVFSSLPGELRLRSLGELQDAGNVSFVDRPVQRRTFLAAMHAALRARERQYEARRAIESRDQFLAMLGHELRNPLSAVRFATDLIVRRTTKDGWVAKHAETIERQTTHLNRLVDDLLDVSRVTSGKVILRKEPTELGALVLRCVESLQTMADAHGVSLEHRGSSTPVPVDGDGVRLEQVVSNLVTNAIKYTPRSGRVEVDLRAQDELAILVVRDTGVGIPPEHIDSIFDLFCQAPTGLDRAKGGLGLGLTLVRALVGMHGGTVAARSDGAGQGSEFSVRLPMCTPGAATALGAAPPSGSDGVRIVLVDDNVDIRETLSELLLLDGYRVSGAADGPQGLTRILSEVPHVALVDVGLPGFDGYELARRARACLGQDLVLIAMTGYGQPDDRAHAFEAGFDEHVVKPVSVEDLAAAMERARARKAPPGQDAPRAARAAEGLGARSRSASGPPAGPARIL
ncbi:MAG TPA: hybrid sensor histidine kinase/response regulator [Polyangia bacterium]|nr:hybrid sensor histidine kinase/response regulator [Polyangia bacterium]